MCPIDDSASIRRSVSVWNKQQLLPVGRLDQLSYYPTPDTQYNTASAQR